MEYAVYKQICRGLDGRHGEGQAAAGPLGRTLATLAARHRVPYEVVRGIYATRVKSKVKLNAARHHERRMEYLGQYRAQLHALGGAAPEDVLLELAEAADMQPYLFARLILFACFEHCQSPPPPVTTTTSSDGSNGGGGGAALAAAEGGEGGEARTTSPNPWQEELPPVREAPKRVANAAVRRYLAAMEDTGEAPGELLRVLPGRAGAVARQVKMCAEFDDSYGPLNDRVRQSIGLEYEFRLRHRLSNAGIPFLPEEMLRMANCAKTPDAVLPYPLEVGGVLVYWIDSKACFGDKDTMSSSFRDQFYAYLSRFKSGLVIYWHSYIRDLRDSGGGVFLDAWQRDGILVRDAFPEDAVLRTDLPAASLPGS